MASPDRLTSTLSLIAMLMFGAIFGFFYAWVCSTMWGLDQADPIVAVTAMQAMNASVRNAVFFPAFFLTPVVGLAAAASAWRTGARLAAILFTAASAIYVCGALLPTAMVNVPMNEALAVVTDLERTGRAARIWADYSPRWQAWNIARTVASGLALLVFGIGLLNLQGQASKRVAVI
ncbi:DUF1772 domain-containing protein [Ahrensia sp. R2A130]|uniref:anthrone oxygenase family protein n=1 Tax=Ahrensia sp. R2A130 TaxID=744979 RepID=UPI0001E0F0AF|nr:anthrone oxygenase family protein [Ahrensia sp. R2A130]EFL89156.1 putative integral membrane protein [Ahrensia sp. R2A130]